MNQHPIFSEHPGLIIVFAVAVVIMLLLDLGIFNKKSHVVTNKEAITWSLVWISLAMIFSGLIYHFAGAAKFYEFQSAYWIEKALSVDNLFVFILVFKFFDVQNENKHKVLFWGIIGALVLRAIFIFSGAFLIELTYLNKLLSLVGVEGFKYDINLIMTAFGLFLVYAGIKSWSAGDDDDEEDYNNTRGARLIRKFFSVSDKYDGDKFFTYENGKKLATPLLVVVAVIEFTDLLFAVDSIPAIFAISNDPFILYTSNIFAILGLRALFFLLDNFIHLFSKLQYGLAIILSFIGVKMIIAPFYHIDSIYSLIVIGGILVISVVLSILLPEPKEATEV
ncbi:Putative membrane-bound redox modulator Alx [Flavobacterium bizetiae]|uniref:Membrane-bound redox modulator Alx n=1 Tax=Flavobacterium bizetiae TaxID=2704140 RepID=A0A6J4GR63_9FLAO|nr:TerC/Alx family metal homeostasis membrane protein [Flavobacterium bizetiae]CAA9201318.1 Putative membrane-bound redox modulator Alx [Flavobacterium bizetiae]CAD5344090.1 Putative membrane-bound redox modulator Alx [Flavobacterium bizetiae]CAD5350094.1 Putative membrane-bound redox modulator Alx [Flavobacterium bizetiae]